MASYAPIYPEPTYQSAPAYPQPGQGYAQPLQPAYASAPPGSYPPAQATPSHVAAPGWSPPKKKWAHDVCSCFDFPGGCGTACFVLFCTPCAAGEVARASGRSYCMSCLVIPFVIPFCAPGCYSSDREALAKAYGIEDQLGWLVSCLLFSTGVGEQLPSPTRGLVRGVTGRFARGREN
jgi:hypothetical protein